MASRFPPGRLRNAPAPPTRTRCAGPRTRARGGGRLRREARSDAALLHAEPRRPPGRGGRRARGGQAGALRHVRPRRLSLLRADEAQHPLRRSRAGLLPQHFAVFAVDVKGAVPIVDFAGRSHDREGIRRRPGREVHAGDRLLRLRGQAARPAQG